jgi:hypothetical protein
LVLFCRREQDTTIQWFAPRRRFCPPVEFLKFSEIKSGANANGYWMRTQHVGDRRSNLRQTFFCEGIFMCEKKDDPKTDTSGNAMTVADSLALGGVFALAGFVFGTLIAGPGAGIAFALIWGGQTTLIAATGYEVQATDIS